MPIIAKEIPQLNKDDVLRFLSKITFSKDCWKISGSRGNGYSQFLIRGKNYPSHRVSYEFFHKAKVPTNMVIDHLCRVPNCVNPSHLEIVTSAENNYRGESPWGKNKRKTHCINGHPFEGDNLYDRIDRKWRQCKKCHRDSMKLWIREKRKKSKENP